MVTGIALLAELKVVTNQFYEENMHVA